MKTNGDKRAKTKENKKDACTLHVHAGRPVQPPTKSAPLLRFITLTTHSIKGVDVSSHFLQAGDVYYCLSFYFTIISVADNITNLQ